MAKVTDGYECHVTLIDNGSNTSVLTYQLVEATLFVDALADAQAIVALLETVTQAEVKGYTVAERFIENALALPVSGVQVENIAAVVCQIDGNPLKKVTVKIPAASPDIFVATSGPGANVIDTADTDLHNYIDIWKATGALASISDGEFILDGLTGSILSGRRIHRQSSRG